jgi:predicted transcriptional regulator of viral defense system
MDWISLLRRESRTDPVIEVERLAKVCGLTPQAVADALRRYERKGFVQRVSKRIYLNGFAASATARDFVNLLRPQSYISLGSALREWGISTQSPRNVTCVTTSRPGIFRIGPEEIVFKKISDKLFWGFLERRTRYRTYRLAEPEKAVLDYIYFAKYEGLLAGADEFDLSKIDREKLLSYAIRFPKPVREAVTQILARVPRAA